MDLNLCWYPDGGNKPCNIFLFIQDDKFVSHFVADSKGKQKASRRTNCSPEKQQDDDVIIMDDKEKSRQIAKYKLLQFHENYRPAYYGTWQKSSTIIQPRNPFKKDEVSFCNNNFQIFC